jgi:hypothetical protein
LLSSGVIFLSLLIKKPVDGNILSDKELFDNTRKDYDDFSVEKVSLVNKKNSNTFFSLTAERITHRKRVSKLFIYQNIKEISVSGAKIDIYVYKDSSATKFNNNSTLLDNIKAITTALGKSPTAPEDYLNNRIADSELEILSRMIFDDLSINIYLSKEKRISIHSTNASINANLENIVFAGDVNIVDSNNRLFISPKAVLSNKYWGIYFPEGYVVKNRAHKKRAFYAINQQGNFLKTLNMLTIQYLDLIDKSENDYYPKLLEKLPPQVKLMLGLPPSR